MAWTRVALAALLLLPISVQAGPAQAGPAPARLSAADARHFLARTGFAPTPAEIARYQGLTRAEAVRRLFAGIRTEAITPPPDWTSRPEPIRGPGRMASADERQAFRKARVSEAVSLVGWWYREMVATPSPFTERMTLFWHNHFTSALRKVHFPLLLYRQNVTLRRYALGNFADLLEAMAADPAMIVYLDNLRNRRGRPNENFAREMMELFTLGEGRGYTEADVKAAARAFTGWSLDRETAAFRFRPALHDFGEKTFMGRAGRFDGTDILRIVLSKPQVADFITRKAWREFVSERPDPASVKRIAAKFRASGYDIKTMMSALLLSPQFWARENRGRLVRSPVELIVGTLRQFRLPVPPDRFVLGLGRAMGQQIFDPPNVKGWPGGDAWITADTLLVREQLLRRLMGRGAPIRQARAERGMEEDRRAMERSRARRMARFRGIDLDEWYATLDPRWQSPERLAMLLLPIKPVHPPNPDSDPARFTRDLVLDPAFQLK